MGKLQKHKSNKKDKRKKKQQASMASKADKHDLYQKSVQSPEAEVHFCNRVFEKEYKQKPLILREDFCGTAAVCCSWVESHKDRRAYGVDLDSEPMEWGREHNLSKLQTHERERIELIQGDVRSAISPKADVLTAQNFSYFIFRERNDLLKYFCFARKRLNKQGVFIIDLMGGPKCQEEELEEPRRKKGFTYVWEHHKFDPITHHCTCYIHFRFKDGSEMKRIFKYPWRLWTMPELKDVLSEAGFSLSVVYWEGTDSKTGEGNGIYKPKKHAVSDHSWIAYCVSFP